MPDKNLKKIRRWGLVFIPLLIFLALAKVAYDRGALGVLAESSTGYALTDSGFSSVGGYSEVPGELGADQQMKPQAMLAREDYQAVYNQAAGLLGEGVHFRTQEIQLPYDQNGYTGYVNLLASSTITMALQNYADFNSGNLFYAYCSDYSQVDEQGYCPESAEHPEMIRNKLIRAIFESSFSIGSDSGGLPSPNCGW